MKITLAFCVFNKADTIAAVLTSWLATLSHEHTYEAIIVCDACIDGTQERARETLIRFTPPLKRWSILETPDVYEIAANNAALEWASADSDLIAFIQDDNTQFTQGWDRLLVEARRLRSFPGCTAMLAGGIFHPDGVGYSRIESNTPHKGEYFTTHGISETTYPPGIYNVDFITRPFAVGTPLLREMGGLGFPGGDVICWDDTDLSVKMLKAGYANQYISMDVLNTCSGQATMKERMARSFTHNHKLFVAAHAEWLRARETNSFKHVTHFSMMDLGVAFVYPIHDL